MEELDATRLLSCLGVADASLWHPELASCLPLSLSRRLKMSPVKVRGGLTARFLPGSPTSIPAHCLVLGRSRTLGVCGVRVCAEQSCRIQALSSLPGYNCAQGAKCWKHRRPLGLFVAPLSLLGAKAEQPGGAFGGRAPEEQIFLLQPEPPASGGSSHWSHPVIPHCSD